MEEVFNFPKDLINFAVMKHITTTFELDKHEVTLYSEPDAEALFLQPVDSHDMEEMAKEIEYIEENSGKRFTLAAIKINKWNEELTPWQAPPVFGKIPFGSGAPATLSFITEVLAPQIQNSNCVCNVCSSVSQEKSLLPSRVFLGGYSLAGLFALWASCQTDVFDGIVAASPSVWFKDWLDYSRSHECKAKNVYLSLGDRESHSKNKLMATVGEAIQEQKKILDSQGINNTLEWNPGNHFTDNGIRTAKGFVWLL